MASRRMFNTSVVNSDAFIDHSTEARLLYFALLGKADDDGYVDCAKGLCRSWGLKTKALEELVEAGYLMDFGEVMLIVHWNQHNRVPRDRYHPTRYRELAHGVVINEQGIYEKMYGGDENTTFSSENSLDTEDKKEENKTKKTNTESITDAARSRNGSGDIFRGAMKMLQIRHNLMVHNHLVEPDDFDEQPLPENVLVTPQMTRMRRQLDAVSRRLEDGNASAFDQTLYKNLFGTLLRLANG